MNEVARLNNFISAFLENEMEHMEEMLGYVKNCKSKTRMALEQYFGLLQNYFQAKMLMETWSIPDWRDAILSEKLQYERVCLDFHIVEAKLNEAAHAVRQTL